MQQGAIILCGGRSSRMGRDKATLPFGPEVMLQRVVRLIESCVRQENIVVVAAPGQALPALPLKVSVAHDTRECCGPLQGLATGLEAFSDRVDAVYATACDVPLLVPAFVTRMFDLLGDSDVAVPYDGQHYHPLAAVYRPSVLSPIQTLLDSDQLSLTRIFDLVRTRQVPIDELRVVDPQLSTLENLNVEADYRAALWAAGLSK
jgi:molybdopterin-guanine dinucleotide biosynthesis protein A